MVKFRHFLEKFYVAIIFVLLYLPIAVLTVMSFNNSRYMKWGGFTLRWYEDLFTSGPIMEALRNTLLLAVLSALIATVVGTLACVGILYMRKRSQSAIMSVNSIPLLNADIVTGIALMLLFVRMFGNLNFTTMLIAHISASIFPMSSSMSCRSSVSATGTHMRRRSTSAQRRFRRFSR